MVILLHVHSPSQSNTAHPSAHRLTALMGRGGMGFPSSNGMHPPGGHGCALTEAPTWTMPQR